MNLEENLKLLNSNFNIKLAQKVQINEQRGTAVRQPTNLNDNIQVYEIKKTFLKKILSFRF